MKKLLSTSALIGAIAISSPAYAGGGESNASTGGGLNVTVGGLINAQAGYSDNDAAYETGSFSRELKFANDTEIHVNVSGQSDSGLRYGARIELEADVTADNRGEGVNADKTFIWIESDDTGRVELGNNEGVAAAMNVTAANIASATGGIDGDDEFYINSSAAAFLVRPDLPTANARGVVEDATKITYYTPSANGFQAGVSFTPDQGDGGTAAGFTGENGSDYENVFELGLNYSTKAGEGLDISAGLTGEFGSSESAAVEDLAAWNLGLVIGHESGFSLAGSYADWDDSGLAVGSTQDTKSWTVGAAYASGDVTSSVTYLDSELNNNEFTNLVFGVDYAAAPGLTPYAEVSFFDTDDNNIATSDNSGSTILVGTYLSF